MTWKRALVIVGIVLALIGLPVLLLCDPMMETYADWASANRGGDFARWTLETVGDAYRKTFRYAQASVVYRRFIDQYPRDEALEQVRYFNALCLENGGDSVRALEEYTAYVEDYPESDYADDASIAINRLKTR